MKAIRLEEPKNFQYVDVADPGQPGPGQVLVRTHRMGVCGTDLSGWLGKFPFFRYPRIPGHELGVESRKRGKQKKKAEKGSGLFFAFFTKPRALSRIKNTQPFFQGCAFTVRECCGGRLSHRIVVGSASETMSCVHLSSMPFRPLNRALCLRTLSNDWR